jgi:hypothetical protein
MDNPPPNTQQVEDEWRHPVEVIPPPGISCLGIPKDDRINCPSQHGCQAVAVKTALAAVDQCWSTTYTWDDPAGVVLLVLEFVTVAFGLKIGTPKLIVLPLQMRPAIPGIDWMG